MKRLAAATAGAALALCAAAGAAWSPATTLGKVAQGVFFFAYDQPRSYVAADANGNAVVTWQADSRHVATAFRSAAGTWTTRRVVAREGVVAANADGQAVLITGEKAVQARTGQLLRAAWSKPRTIGGWHFEPPLAAIDQAARITVVWQGPNRTIVAARGPFTGKWSLARVISGKPGAESPRLAVGADGSVTVSWVRALRRSDGPSPYRIEARRFAPGTGWAAIKTVVALASLDNLQGAEQAVVADPDGGATVLWAENRRPAEDRLLFARLAPGAARWSAPAVAVGLGDYLWQSPRADGGLLRVATNARGDALVAWTSTFYTGVGTRVGLALRTAGSSDWHELALPNELAAAPVVPRIALGDDGAVYAADALGSIVTAARPAGRTTWQVSRPGSGRQLLGVTPGLTAWTTGEGGGSVRTSSYAAGG